MAEFIDDYREDYSVEPICNVLPMAPSTYYEQNARQADPTRLPTRSVRDAWLREEIERVWKENRSVYGARKTWLQLNREGFAVARCTVERLMHQQTTGENPFKTWAWSEAWEEVSLASHETSLTSIA